MFLLPVQFVVYALPLQSLPLPGVRPQSLSAVLVLVYCLALWMALPVDILPQGLGLFQSFSGGGCRLTLGFLVPPMDIDPRFPLLVRLY